MFGFFIRWIPRPEMVGVSFMVTFGKLWCVLYLCVWEWSHITQKIIS